jgi:hypothetical protein
LGVLAFVLSSSLASGQGREAAKPAPAARPRPAVAPLFFSEAWRIAGPPRALARDYERDDVVSNPNLELKVYGGCARDPDPDKRVWISGNAAPDQALANPPNIWAGMCQVPVAVTLRDKTRFVDLSGPGRLKWLIRTGGFHAVRPVVKLADGTFLVADYADSMTNAYLFFEHGFALAGLRWLKLDPEKIVTTGKFSGPDGAVPWVTPDLSKVDEIGFVDLMPSSAHCAPGSVNLARFEVYGRAVPRQ